jgi:DNA-binding CsgD family transcriptional regulator
LEELLGGQQMVAAQEIETELENVRAAWTWAVDHSKIQAIKNAVQALDTFFQFQSRYKEGLEAMRRAAASLEKIKPSQARDLTLAEVLVCQGWLSIRLGDFTGAQTSLQASQDLFTRFELPFPPGLGTDPQIPLSLLAALQGDYNQAVKLGDQALKACIADKELNNLPVIHYVLASAWSSMGDYTQANHHARLACQIVSEAHNRWMLAYCLNAWGGIELKLGNYDQAKDNYLASYEIRKDFADPEGMAVALNHLGVIELRRENFNQSRQLFERSLALYEKLDDVGGLATTINGLAFASTGLGEYSRANREFHRALQLASGIQYISLTIWVLIGIGNLFCKTGRIVRGLDLLRLANHHPASEREAVERSQEFIDRELRDPSAGSWAKSEVAEQKLTLESVVAELLVDLTRMDFSNLETGSLLKPQNHPEQKLPTQQLIDPLTDRELEVLRLLALGLANREIAVKLFLSVGTVKWYTGQVYQKLQVGNRTQAVARGREIGLLD